MNKKFIVKIGANAYLINGDGDPPRTLLLMNAKRFNSEKSAKRAITAAQKTHPLKELEYKIEEINET